MSTAPILSADMRDDAVLAEVIERYGMGGTAGLAGFAGDISHLISPIVGMLRMQEAGKWEPTSENIVRFIERLSLALALAQRVDPVLREIAPQTPYTEMRPG